MAINPDHHWRDSARPARFFFVDAIGALPLLLVLLHIRLWTFLLALSVMVFLSVLERFQFTIPVFFRFIAAYIAGPVKSANPWWRN